MPARSPFRAAMLALLALVATAPAAAQTMVSVARPIVHMREGAGTAHAAKFRLPQGYPLKVVARRDGWLKVRDFENDTGWVLGRLTDREPHVVVKVPVANLRSAPGTRHRIVARADHGEVLRTLERREGWLRVRRDSGRSGWVARRLVWGW